MRSDPARWFCWVALGAIVAAGPPARATAQGALAPPKSGLVVVEPDPKPMSKGTGLIAGQVELAGAGAQVAGALVVLRLPGGERAAAIANADGRFVFTALPSGAFTLTATQSGYLEGAFGRVRPSGASQILELAAGQQRTGITITLWKQGAVTGTVIDEAAEPLVNGPLQILRRDIVAGAKRLSPAGTVKTDDRGIYRFWGLDPGDYVVALPLTERPAAPGDPAGPQTYPAMYYLEAISASRATVIHVASGEERMGVDFMLRPVRALTVSGSLRAPDGPAAGVPVQLFPAEATDVNSSIETAVVRSGADGAFAFSNVSPGLYTLRAVKMTTAADLAPPGATLSAVDRVMPLADAAILWAEASVAVEDKGLSGIVVTLQRAGRLSGAVQFDRGQAPPVDLTVLEVFLTPADGRLAALPSRGPVRADGTFSTAGVLPGRYVIRVAGIIPGWYLSHATVNGTDASDVPIEIGSTDLTGGALTYTDHPTRVSGRVTTQSGSADRTSSVVFFPIDSTIWSGVGASAARMRRVRTTEDGAYAVINLPAGSYYAAALPDDVAADWNDLAMLDALSKVATRVEIAEGVVRTQDLRLVKITR